MPLLLLLFSGAPALAQASGWSVSEAKGVVVVIDAQGQRPARAGTVLAAGATIRTDARSSAVLVRGREFVTMRQNAQLRIPAPAQARSRGLIQIIQDYGSALFNIGKQKNPHFGVETPYMAAVVKGTTFVITVSGEGASLQVTEGAVEAATNDGGVRELIRPGAVAMIAAGDPLRMVVEGEGRRVLDSPARPASGGPAAATPASASGGVPAAQEPAAASARGQARIEQAIVSTPGDVGAYSRGFASGEVAVMAAVVADNTGRGNAPAVGNNGGRSPDDAGCAGSTCVAGGGNGGGNGGANVGTGGNGANPGNGNGNGGAGNGSNGNGNGNGGAGNGSSGNGNGNSGNGGGNNSGNGGDGVDGGDGDDEQPGNGNGNGGDEGNPGNGGGNGNGGDEGSPGNGGGNGNGGDEGNPGNGGGGNGNGGDDGNPGNGGGGNGGGGNGGGGRNIIRLGGEVSPGADLGLTYEPVAARP